MSPAIDPDKSADWYDREVELVDRALNTTDTYRYADPTDTDYVAGLIDQMERAVEELSWIRW